MAELGQDGNSWPWVCFPIFPAEHVQCASLEDGFPPLSHLPYFGGVGKLSCLYYGWRMFFLPRTVLKMSEEARLQGLLARLEHSLALSERKLSPFTPNLLRSQSFYHTLKTYSSSPHHHTHFPLDHGELTRTLGQETKTLLHVQCLV